MEAHFQGLHLQELLVVLEVVELEVIQEAQEQHPQVPVIHLLLVHLKDNLEQMVLHHLHKVQMFLEVVEEVH